MTPPRAFLARSDTLRLLQEIGAITDPQERLAAVVRVARSLPGFEEQDRSETNRVHGCTARLWLVRSLLDGRCQFRCDSDSQIVKGVASLLCGSLSGLLPGEVLAASADPLEEAGLRQHLTPSRREGLGRVRESLQEFGALHTSGASGLSPRLALFDAHNHLQDDRFGGPTEKDRIVSDAISIGVVRMVVNGSCEADWRQVIDLSERHPCVIPSVGYHPWHLRGRPPHWQASLSALLANPRVCVGEIGLDRWMTDFDAEDQEEVFLWQWRLACDLGRPVSIHCLKAWGRLEQLLRQEPRAPRGFLLHSYGGPPERVASFAKLGARFGFPGYFLHERKLRQRQTFLQIPRELILVETDAPDQVPPEHCMEYRLPSAPAGKALNHPGNLGRIQHALANLLGMDEAELASRIGTQFKVLFGE